MDSAVRAMRGKGGGEEVEGGGGAEGTSSGRGKNWKGGDGKREVEEAWRRVKGVAERKGCKDGRRRRRVGRGRGERSCKMYQPNHSFAAARTQRTVNTESLKDS